MRSQFGSVLLKYIPGKIWVPLGKASSLTSNNEDVLRISGIAFIQQIVFTFWGLLLGACSIILIWPDLPFIWLIYLSIGGLGIIGVWASTKRWNIKQKQWGPFTRLEGFHIPKLTNLLLWICLHWSLLGFAYYIVYCSLIEVVPLASIPVQILANNIGMMAIFMPAGLGVREGIVALFFNNVGLDAQQILALCIGSRIWFILGEAVVYLVTFALREKPSPR